MNKIAIFAGSFDPFTIGHKNIVDRALESVADEVIIAIGINYEKKYMFSLEERLEAIRKAYQNEPRVRVETYEGLTTDFAKRVGAEHTYLIHPSHDIGLHDEVCRSLPSDIELAYDGQVVNVEG